MKKIISFFLSVIIMCSALVLPAHAADSCDGILFAPPKTDSPNEPAESLPADSAGYYPWHYVFLTYSAAELEAIAAAIAASASYGAGYDEFGQIGYWVSLRISEHPEIANAGVLSSTAEIIAETVCNLLVEQGIDTGLVNLNHVTGELSLHVLAILVMDTLIKAMWPDFDSYYEMFDLADLNADEQRLPPALLIAIGTLIRALF